MGQFLCIFLQSAGITNKWWNFFYFVTVLSYLNWSILSLFSPICSSPWKVTLLRLLDSKVKTFSSLKPSGTSCLIPYNANPLWLLLYSPPTSLVDCNKPKVLVSSEGDGYQHSWKQISQTGGMKYLWYNRGRGGGADITAKVWCVGTWFLGFLCVDSV